MLTTVAAAVNTKVGPAAPKEKDRCGWVLRVLCSAPCFACNTDLHENALRNVTA